MRTFEPVAQEVVEVAGWTCRTRCGIPHGKADRDSGQERPVRLSRAGLWQHLGRRSVRPHQVPALELAEDHR